MREPLSLISNWMLRTPDVLMPPPDVRAAYRQVERENEARAQHWIDWDESDLDRFIDIVDQQRLEFAEEDTHANVRQAVAQYIERVVLPCDLCVDPAMDTIPSRLRAARQTGTMMYHPGEGRFITIWDEKAGLRLLCPDDAREESMRVSRRYVPSIADWRNNGKAVHKLVLNPPNIARGELRAGMRDLFKTFNRIFFKSGRFPEVKGALVTLEAPLSVSRSWNVHLNVILLCDGFLDYNKIVAAWGHQFDAYRLHGDREQIEAALREQIKYAAQAMPSKSDEHRRRGISEAPAMLEWTAEEFLEWWGAHQRFRRTRSYGLLFGLKEPEPESLDGFVAVGAVSMDGTKRIRRLFLLDSIPGDKSSPEDRKSALKSYIRRLTGPPDRHKAALAIMHRALNPWHTQQ